MSHKICKHHLMKSTKDEKCPYCVAAEQAEKIQQRDDSIKLYKATLVQNGLDMTGMRAENQRLKDLVTKLSHGRMPPSINHIASKFSG